MTDHEQLIDTYLGAYGDPDAATRAEAISRVFSAGATLTDPPFTATGHAELDASFAAVQQQFPGHRFTRTSAIDAHHDTARYTWSLDGPDGSTAVTGTDIVGFGDDGTIVSVTGFFGDPAPLV